LIKPYAPSSDFQGHVGLFDEVCMACSCGCLIKWGFYPRFVEDEDNVVRMIRVQRFCCKGCGRTFSYPPPEVVAYKRFDSRVIGQVLFYFLLAGWSLDRVWRVLNCASVSSMRRWVNGFRARCESVRKEGFIRLRVAEDGVGSGARGVFLALVDWCDELAGDCAVGVIGHVQAVLMGGVPQVGLFHSF